MVTTFIYGDQQLCQAELGDCSRVGANDQSVQQNAAIDPVEAVRTSLAHPAGYPPLAAATVPGDHVAIALADDVPARDQVLCGAVAGLLDAGVDPALITVVTAGKLESRDRLREQLTGIGAEGVSFERHDPDDEDQIAMIGVNIAGEPLRMNRTIAEADLVLPIAGGESDGATDGSRFSGLYPQFSNRETINRLRPHGVKERAKQRSKRNAEIDDAGWKLGVGMTVRVIPGAGGTVAAVEAGDPTAVDQTTQLRARDVWETTVDRTGDLVVAAIVGDERQQTWENLARALRAAETVLDAGGAIAVCSAIAALPSSTFNPLRDAVDFEEVQRELATMDADDLPTAMTLAQALERGPVYLRSQLPTDVVESLGMTPFESDGELSRLAASRGHCVLIEDAQRVAPKLASQPRR